MLSVLVLCKVTLYHFAKKYLVAFAKGINKTKTYFCLITNKLSLLKSEKSVIPLKRKHRRYFENQPT